MALVKSVQWCGWEYQYWVITSHRWDKASNSTWCNLLVYKDKTTREEDFGAFIPALEKNFVVAGELTRDELYTFIKTTPEFLDAIDG